MPLLATRSLVARCETGNCAISQYIDTVPATGALWASVVPMALLLYSVARSIDSALLTLLVVLQLMSWALFTVSPYATHAGRHNCALFAWIASTLGMLWFLIYWTRLRAGSVPRTFTALVVAASITMFPLITRTWALQSAAITLLVGAIAFWYARYAHLLPLCVSE